MASRRMPRLMAWVASVWRSWWGWTRPNAGGSGDAAHDAADDVPVEDAAVVGDEPLAAADVLEVRGGPLGEQRDEVGVQGDVAVVAELADRDPQPVPVADLDDGIRVEVAQLAGAQPGAGEQLDHEPVAGVGAGPGGGHQPGGVAVVEELRQRLGLRGGMSPAMIGLRGGASGQSHSMIRSKNMRTMRSR